ncbi:DUF2778 domain-containing protein [Pseudomonas sp. Pseu.R1]|uniref:DUF2778 domain-containing protein n=1 Tax=Pseudomonas sp. Pseu.R1 TaxID=3379818 RepID=UPI003B93DF05
MSTLVCPGVGFFPAYSGQAGSTRNNPDDMAIQEIGPLPTGRYYIVDRPKGGTLGWFRDYRDSIWSGSDRDLWFGLFKDDSQLDDQTFVDSVRRGEFRLHPAGYRGISMGCITLPDHCNYATLRNALLATTPMNIRPTLTAYGTVQVY